MTRTPPPEAYPAPIPPSPPTTSSATTAPLDYSEVIDLLPVPTLVVSPANRIQRVSRGLLHKWRRAEEEFLSRDLYAALFEWSPMALFDRIPLAYAIEQAVLTRKPRLCHAAYTRNDVAWSARIVPVFRGDELLCLVLEWEEVQLKSGTYDGDFHHPSLSIDEAFRILVQTVKDYAIFLLDTRGNVATWNTGAELLKGYTRDEVIGRHFSVFYGEDDRRANKPARKLETCLREGTVEDQGWRYRKDGSRFWANVVITAVYQNGVHVGFGKVTRDMTEWKQAEMKLIAAYKESTKLKNDFLANMSHEIRTPMHGMLSACNLLLETRLDEEQRETANIIEESGQVLRQVINDILDYSKLTSGNFSVTEEVVDFNGIMTSVVRSVHTTLQPGVKMDLCLGDLPKEAHGDPLRLRQIAENIVGNAAKFTERGTISVRASLLSEDEAAYTVLAEVYDTGPGISEDDARTLFKPFQQVDTTITKRYQGTGLGLSIAKSLASLMGGDIGYRPNPEGRGSVFWFTAGLKKIHGKKRQVTDIDRAAEENRAINRQLLIEAEDANAPLRRLRDIAHTKRILVAEDNIINQKVLVGMLQSFGLIHITVVPDGAQAVAAVAEDPGKYDLVLMDISMPVMDGYQATARIQNMGPHPPILAMTAYALKGDMEMCLEKGMDDYIAKPVNKPLLVKKLLDWLSRGEGGEDGNVEGEGSELVDGDVDMSGDEDGLDGVNVHGEGQAYTAPSPYPLLNGDT